MRMIDLIEKKKQGDKLTYDELKYIIDSYVSGLIPDYQVSALLMAIYFVGMDDIETTNLSKVMLESGDSLDLSSIDGIKVDKHSTGGVGDKTSLVLGPMVAALGIKFAKMSGKGLGHTGGTLDKLEAIPGYRINISDEEFIEQVKDINIALVGQSGNLTPADKKLYALRDVTATVDSIPLIASSIMSKKLASGADAIVLDVKVGNGAFMKDLESARDLARLMVKIGANCGRKMTAVLTDMDEPLGYAVGNSLEVIEAINTLNGNGPSDLLDLCVEIGAYLVVDAYKASSIEEAKNMLLETIRNKKAIEYLIKLVEKQGGDISYIKDINKFPKSKYVIEIKAAKNGYVSKIDSLMIGHAAMLLGAGRSKLEDKIDNSVGIVLNKKVSNYVSQDEVLATVYSNKNNIDEVLEIIKAAFIISNNSEIKSLILEVIK